jgi:hypothetical protein
VVLGVRSSELQLVNLSQIMVDIDHVDQSGAAGTGPQQRRNNTREPPTTPFHQQKLKNWSFVFPKYGFSIALIILGIIFVPVGTTLRRISDNVCLSNRPKCRKRIILFGFTLLTGLFGFHYI